MVENLSPQEQEVAVAAVLDECLTLGNMSSFFLFAGAGSGKTRSLVGALQRFREKYGEQLRKADKQVAVITYTNAACDEIVQRLEYDPAFHVSTIHSFVWSFLEGHDSDIKIWIKSELEADIAELQALEAKGKAGKASDTRKRDIQRKLKKLEYLPNIRRFTYSPSGDNRSRESLNHSQVVRMAADFLKSKPLLRRIVTSQFPAILIDESQDTNKHLIEALFFVEEEERPNFCLGLFGDTMQRIYADGKKNLGEGLPEWWKKPAKTINYRCPARVVELINKIRQNADGQMQTAADGAAPGVVRLFIAPSEIENKSASERSACQKMAVVTKDVEWESASGVKTLILEHHMAARRQGFLELFAPLYQVDSLKTGLLDGTLPGLKLFWNLVLPLVRAKISKDDFAVASIVREHSPLIAPEKLKGASSQRQAFEVASAAVNAMIALWEDGRDPRCIDVLSVIRETGLFDIPESLSMLNYQPSEEPNLTLPEDDSVEEEQRAAWANALQVPCSQVGAYAEYVLGDAAFDTHQGVKGREFPRVLIVIDDMEARGFMFSYEKMFGVKAKSKSDISNIESGQDNTLDRTMRLFYVTCSRAEKSLAIVAYTESPEILKRLVIERQWFATEEIELI